MLDNYFETMPLRPERIEVLQKLSFGHRVAEEELKDLAKYFVETEQWRRIHSGEVDIVYGPKGSGKSALYALLMLSLIHISTKYTTLRNGGGRTENRTNSIFTANKRLRRPWRIAGCDHSDTR